MACVIKKYIPLNKKIKLSFVFDNCIIETITDSNEFRMELEYGCLVISITLELKSYESLTDAAAFSRPKYLNLLGIVSFLTDEPFDVFVSKRQESAIQEDNSPPIVTTKFIYEDIDRTDLLNELINALNGIEKHKLSLIFSLFDRWRKARYLEKESKENFLYDDEATLSYFHVLELLADVYAKQLRKDADKLIEEFSKSYNSNILHLANTTLDSKNSEITRLLKSILNKEISVNSKIIYLLKEFNLHSIETTLWVKILIESRNSVAHGRRVYYDKAIYPVKPFYPLITNELYPLEFLRIFIAKVICSHLDISLFDEKWNEIKESFIPDEFATKELINSTPIEVSNLSEQEEKIIFGGLNHFIITRKIQIKDSKDVYKFYLKTEINNKNFLHSNIDAIVLLYESNISDIDDLLKEAIINTHKNDCNPHYKFRDMMYYLDFHNFQTPRLEDLIINNEVK